MSDLSSFFTGMRAASTGLTAERTRIDVIASNIANAHTTSREHGPYRRQEVHFEPILQKLENGQVHTVGVRVSGIFPDMQTPTESVYDPGHPHANAEGWLEMPNVNPTQEMADLITAMRAYEANLRAQEAFIDMAERALTLAR